MNTRRTIALSMLLGIVIFHKTATANLILNGSFETGDFTSWTPLGDVSVENNNISTDGIFAANFNRGDTAPNAVLSQAFPTTIGQHYSLEFNYGVVSYIGVGQSLETKVLGSQTLVDSFVTGPAATHDPTIFGDFSFPFIADATTTTVQFLDATSNNTVATDGILDNVNVSVSAVPEPSSLALLGATGLLMLRRHRQKNNFDAI